MDCDYNICGFCILYGFCDGRCGDTDPLFYAEETYNDLYGDKECESAGEEDCG